MPINLSGLNAGPPSRFPSASGGIARLAYAYARDGGVEVEPLLTKAGLTVAQIEDRTVRLQVLKQIRFLDFVAAAVPDPFLGFHLARTFDPREIGLLHYVLASSDRLDDALQRVARYSTNLNEGVALKYSERNDVVMIVSYLGVARHSDRQQIEFWVTALVRSCRELTGRQVAPHRVQFTHHRGEDCAELNAFLGCEAEFGAGADEIAFAGSIKDLPVVSADPYLNDLLTRYCEDALARRSKQGGNLRSSVENAIAPLLPHGKAHVGEIARKLGMSQRTLARHLAAEGLSFSKVLDELRADLARRHLGDADLSISEIAWLLGYQEVSAFTHAFKRWTGLTPREMRGQAA
jgi:AraC-like DNA-binding protein